MKNTLIIQFPAASNPKLDRVIELEETLIKAFSQNGAARVDGHDFGGSANIYLFPKRGWQHAIEIVLAYLKLKKSLDEVLIIKRFKTETYEVVWPLNYTGDFERT